jgi:ferredoxin
MCESNDEDRIIIPPAKALEIAGKASRTYIRECICRAQEQLCPPDTWEVCLLFESASQDRLQNARPISTNEALSILKTTSEQRAIYNLFYTHTGQRLTEICSCCTCCCHPLHGMREEESYSEQLRSEYMAVTDATRCVGCGLCKESCFFEARRVENGTLHLIDQQCFGCGKCIDSCPEKAIVLERQVGRGVAIPIAV